MNPTAIKTTTKEGNKRDTLGRHDLQAISGAKKRTSDQKNLENEDYFSAEQNNHPAAKIWLLYSPNNFSSPLPPSPK